MIKEVGSMLLWSLIEVIRVLILLRNIRRRGDRVLGTCPFGDPSFQGFPFILIPRVYKIKSPILEMNIWGVGTYIT